MVMSRFDPIIADASRRFGVPESRIRAVMQVESSGDPGATSHKGAGGLMQIMPETYEDLRRQFGLGPDRYDPTNNIMGGAAYMRQMYDQFKNWDEATLAYNMGPGRAMQVRNGQASVPAETAQYLPKVQAVLSTFDQNQTQQGGDVPLFGSAKQTSLTGLLDIDRDKNFYEGLGGLFNFGQEPSQPPRTDPAALPGTTQTDRLGVGDRLNSVMQQLLEPQRGPQMSQGGYMMAGALGAVSPLAATRDRKVGLGELLGALGGGLTKGAMAGEAAQRERLGSEFDNLYKFASARKALAPTSDADRYKVVGKQVYDTQTKQFIQSPGGVDQSGPLDGTGFDAQMTNAYIVLHEKQQSGQELTPQEKLLLGTAERHLNRPRVVAGPDGIVREVAPSPLPALPNAGGAGASPPSAAAPPSAGAPPAAPTATVTPSGSRVTEVVPARAREIPAPTQTAMLGNVAALRKLSGALDNLKKAPDATGYGPGILNMLPGQTVNRVMPEGARARADLADIGSMVIHDRSGAAVTVGEMEKLKPFIPTVWDDEATAQMKIGRLQTEIEDILRDQSATYSADQNYKENPVVQDVVKTLRPRAPMSGGEGASSQAQQRRSKYGLE